MIWTVTFHPGVADQLLDMPAGIQARMIRLLEVMEHHGPNLGAPHTKSMGGGLFEIRAKAKEGIGRGLFCYAESRHIHVLVVFVKKSQKTPGHMLSLARSRIREVTGHE